MTLENVWMQTYTGKKFYYLRPDELEVDLLDIAHHLSNECRFNGASLCFYSVAEHSVHVSRQCRSEHAAIGLLHDATEAYLKDIPHPLKRVIRPLYGELERRLATKLSEHFRLDLVNLPLDVHEADRRMLATEKKRLMAPVEDISWDDRGMLEPYTITGLGYYPLTAEEMFLHRAEELGLK